MRLAFGEHQLDTGARTLERGGQAVSIQDKAFDVLVYLIEHRERFVSHDELLDALWPGVNVSQAAVSAAVQKARQAVGDDGERQAVLRTKHGQGFRFAAEVNATPAKDAVPPTPSRSRARSVAFAIVTVLVLTAVAAWLRIRPLAGSAPTRSVAVLPFVNLSQDATAEPFTNGIYDDILTHVSKIHGLKVIARTSMERLEPNLGVREIGNQLGVEAVLEGGVQRAGDRIRINVQLNDCETETHIWAETYDRELTAANIFDIQAEIAASVADALRVTLSPEELDRLATVPTENLAAYQAYLLGKRRMVNGTTAAMREATDYFQQAIERDPSFALAYVGLADSYIWRVDYGSLPREDGLAKAQVATKEALALDDRLGEAYNSLAGIKEKKGDIEAAEATYQRALELNPSYLATYSWYGKLLLRLDRAEEALALHMRAAELDPLSVGVMGSVAFDLQALGRFEESRAWMENAAAVDPGHPEGLVDIGHYHWTVSGQLDEAVVWFAKAIYLDPGNPKLLAWLGRVLLDLGDPGNAAYWIERSIELNPETSEPRIAQWMLRWFLHLYRGDEAALDYFRKSFENSGRSSLPLRFLRDHEVRAGRYAEARALFEQRFPELLSEDDPEIDRWNFFPAINLALVLSKTGEQQRADRLLKRSFQYMQIRQRVGVYTYDWCEVEILALQGQKQKALWALRRSFDEGWRGVWWKDLERNPNLESLHDDPEFQAIVEKIKADMAAQLERVHAMEQRGELALRPDQAETQVPPSGASADLE